MTLSKLFCSTIMKKQVVAITGLGLSFFVLTHMLGNLLLFVSPQAYNEYGHNLVSNPLIYVAEAGLLALFITHLALAVGLSLKNKAAKGVTYAVTAKGDKATSLVTKTMWHQGMLIFVFVVLHLLTFKFGTVYMVDYGQGEIRDLFRLMVETFQSPIYTFGYLACLLVLGFHLSHGVSSALQTLGINHPRYQCLFKKIGCGFALLVSIGFMLQPLYIFFFFQ